MDQSEQNYVSVEKPSETSPGPYTSPPPIGYPTRDAMVGDPPAVALETKSKGAPRPRSHIGCIKSCCNCIAKNLEELDIQDGPGGGGD
ncbi:hypothetical protein ARALYDRAFT_898688 [Arabidopsis lyrata subsp. lyrata]|uniref:Cysteine-rich transmembrane CYSTM domain-containing protein n=1 Tax=Arabidopsis lyrata subsp. lyrata TaxID=81972 RepID=D7L1M0_ARALL|nr:hypothetical protein ARALYDRAFT_898688 [Arabidopsis lyrata subsp. lyrata]